MSDIAEWFLKWRPIIIFVSALIGTNAVQAYQVIELIGENEDQDERISTLEKDKTQQQLIKRDIEYIQKDMENTDDNIKEMRDMMNILLQRIK